MLIGKYNWEDVLDRKLAKEQHDEFTSELVDILKNLNERIYQNSIDIIELQEKQKKTNKQLRKLITRVNN